MTTLTEQEFMKEALGGGRKTVANSAIYTAAAEGRLHVTVRNVRRDLWHQLRREAFERDIPLERILELILTERYNAGSEPKGKEL